MLKQVISNAGKDNKIVIDWSHIVHTSNDVDQMIGWVRNCPPESSVHVVLGKIRQRGFGRKLQGALQALGCTVTTRQFETALA